MPYQSKYDKEASFGHKSIALLRYHHLGHLHNQCGKLESWSAEHIQHKLLTHQHSRLNYSQLYS